jgi:hypothetical protein
VKAKIISCLFVSILGALVLLSATARAQDKFEPITVKSVEVNNGVVIISAHGEKTAIELQCNKDFMGCTTLKQGEYVMVRLPKNHGAYDCSNVTLYAKSTGDAPVGAELGTYCIIGK